MISDQDRQLAEETFGYIERSEHVQADQPAAAPGEPGISMILYISHGAPQSSRANVPNWFVVEPQDDPWPQVESLLKARRRVICVTDTGSGPIAAAIRVLESATYEPSEPQKAARGLILCDWCREYHFRPYPELPGRDCLQVKCECWCTTRREERPPR